MKLEFQSVEEADRALEKGLLMSQMYATADQRTREKFYKLQTCFMCYTYENHTTKDCNGTIIKGSKCA